MRPVFMLIVVHLSYIITSPKEDMCSQTFVVLVCHQAYTKTPAQIHTKLGWGMGLGPERTLLTFGVAPDKG